MTKKTQEILAFGLITGETVEMADIAGGAAKTRRTYLPPQWPMYGVIVGTQKRFGRQIQNLCPLSTVIRTHEIVVWSYANGKIN